MKGILQVIGTLSLSQFWPQGQSDADTAKLLIDVEKGGFTFRSTPKTEAKTTHLFDDAVVHGRITRPVLQKGKLTVRLQGLDSTELHFTPQALVPVTQQEAENHQRFLRWNYAFRQPLAEQSVLALTELLAGAKQEKIACRIETHLDDPAEAFDCYGRLVGDIWVTIGKREVNVNRWLLRSGWAFPAFYNSMSADEIRAITKDSEEARKQNLGAWSAYSAHIQRLNWVLRYRKSADRADKHSLRLILPKLFRRLVTFSVNQRAGLFHGGFRDFLRTHPDACYLTDDFMKNGHLAKRHHLEEFLLPQGLLEVEPHQLVFCETPSRLTGPKGSPLSFEVDMSKKKNVVTPKPQPTPTPCKPGKPCPPTPIPPPKPPNPGPTNPPHPPSGPTI